MFIVLFFGCGAILHAKAFGAYVKRAGYNIIIAIIMAILGAV